MQIYANIELGWSPILQLVSTGTKEILQVAGWTGGVGSAPATGLFVGSNGYVTNITDGVNIKGDAGAGVKLQVGTDILSAGTVLFSNSPTVTFGLVGSTITASVAGGGGGGNVSIQGSTGNISFGNANGMTFGGNASTITASYTVPSVTQFQLSADMTNYLGTGATVSFLFTNQSSLFQQTSQMSLYQPTSLMSNYQSAGAYLTTAMQSNAGSNFVGLNSALTANGVSASINSSGISLNFPAFLTTAQPVGAYLTTAMQSNAGSDFVNTSQSSLFQATSLMSNYQSANAGYLTSQSNQAFSASGSSSTFQTLQFGNTNGVSFSISNGSVVGTVATNYQSQGAYLTTAMQSNAATISNIRLSAGTLSSNRSDMTFSNANGVSFGLETNGVITASVAAAGGAQTAISGLSAGTTQMTSGTASFADGGGVSFGINGNTITATVRTDYQSSGNYLTTAMASNASTNFAGIGSAITNGTMTFGTGGLSLNLSNHLTTARASNDAIGLNTALTANGVAWTVNSSGLSLNIPAFLTTAMQSQSSSNFAGVGSAITNGTMTYGTGGLSLNLSNHLTTAMASNAGSNFVGLNSALTANGVSATINSSGVSLNFPAFLTTAMASNQSSNFAATGFTSTTAAGAVIAGTHNTAGLLLAVPAWLTTAAQSDHSHGNPTLSLAGGLSGATASNSAGFTLSLTQAAAAASPIGISAGTVNNTFGSLTFSNSPSVSFGLGTGASAGVITASVNAGGGGIALANSQTTYTSGTANMVASGALTIGSTTGQSFYFSAPAQSSLSATGQVSISVNGSTISIGVPNNPVISSYENMPIFNSALTYNGASISHAVAFPIMGNLSASFARIPVLMTMNSTTLATLASATATASGALYSTWNAVVYSLGTGASSQSLFSVASGSGGWTFSQQVSITNSTQGSYSLGFSAQAQGVGTTLTTQYSISNTNYSFTTNAFSGFSSNRMLDIPFANSLSAGQYWMVMGYSSSSASGGAAGLAALTNCNAKYSNHYGASISNVSFGVMGSTNATSGGLMGGASFSTAGGGTTSGFNISALSSMSNNAKIYFQLLRSA